MRWVLPLVLLSGCIPPTNPVVVTPTTCYCVAEPVTCEEHAESTVSFKKKRAEKIDRLREETGKAKQQVETMKGIAGKVSTTPTPDER